MRRLRRLIKVNDICEVVRRYQSEQVCRMLGYLKEIGDEQTIKEFLELCRPYKENEEANKNE